MNVRLLLAASLLTSGCSFIFVRPLPADNPSNYTHCTTSLVPPGLDTFFTGTNVLSALYFASQDNVTNKGATVGVGLGVAALWLSSAIYGYVETSACAAARDEDANVPSDQRYRHGYVPPRPSGYPPPPDAPRASPVPAPSQQQLDDDFPGGGAPVAPPRTPPPQAPASSPDGPRFGG